MQQGVPRRPLLGPCARVGHRPEGPLGYRLGAIDGFESQHGVLEIGRYTLDWSHSWAIGVAIPQLVGHVLLVLAVQCAPHVHRKSSLCPVPALS